MHAEKLATTANAYKAGSTIDGLNGQISHYVARIYQNKSVPTERAKITTLIDSIQLLTRNSGTTTALNYFRNEVITDGYRQNISGSNFYPTLRVALEKISYLLTRINANKRGEVLAYLATQVQMCGPGVFTTLNEIAYELENPCSLYDWLVTMRKGIVDTLAAKHIVQARVGSAYNSHVHFAFYQWAATYGLNLPNANEYLLQNDPYQSGAKVDENTQIKFYDDFKELYHGTKILELIINKYSELLKPFMDKDYFNQPDRVEELEKIVAPFLENKIFNIEDICSFDEDDVPCLHPEFTQRLGYYARALLETEEIIQYTEINDPDREVIRLYNDRLQATPNRAQSEARKDEVKSLTASLKNLAQLPRPILTTALRAKAVAHELALTIYAINRAHSYIRQAIIYIFGIWRTRLEESLVNYRNKLERDYGSDVKNYSEFEKETVASAISEHDNRSANTIQRLAINPHFKLNRILRQLKETQSDPSLHSNIGILKRHTRHLALNNQLLSTDQVKLILQLSPGLLTKRLILHLNLLHRPLNKDRVNLLNVIANYGGPEKAYAALRLTDNSLKFDNLELVGQNAKDWLINHDGHMLRFLINEFSAEQILAFFTIPSNCIEYDDLLKINEHAKGDTDKTYKLLKLADMGYLKQCTDSFLKSKSYVNLKTEQLDKETVTKLLGADKRSQSTQQNNRCSLFDTTSRPAANTTQVAVNKAERIKMLEEKMKISIDKIENKYSNVSSFNLWRQFRASNRIEHYQAVINDCVKEIATLQSVL